jgi:hypothetical protein
MGSVCTIHNNVYVAVCSDTCLIILLRDSSSTSTVLVGGPTLATAARGGVQRNRADSQPKGLSLGMKLINKITYARSTICCSVMGEFAFSEISDRSSMLLKTVSTGWEMS